MEVNGHLHAPATLHPQLGAWLGPRASLETGKEKKEFPAPSRNQTPVIQPVA
jgi:hypothetical protein